ncbi:hypothetical protein NC653_039059 [Populus alba x Populus x berolinensis]|uniref:Uncharacterized protein n=1 Tax=Populus alba x Populus x berolinensis TaxID=444605 RepID=A0AAD6LBV0_9ROSI|nr:hypothetical protein NC653_039059 [Populus alba x Populus x berolinensis]
MKFMKLGSKPDAFQADGKSVRYVASELVTDVTINVGEVKFNLHKGLSCVSRKGEEGGQTRLEDTKVLTLPRREFSIRILDLFQGKQVWVALYQPRGRRGGKD